VALVALSGEYPGRSAAGLRVAAREVLPLAAVPWLHLGVLDADAARVRGWAAAAVAADALLLARAIPHAEPGAPPFALALPVVLVLLAAGACAVARTRVPRSRVDYAPGG
jgi:hypothetical protein